MTTRVLFGDDIRSMVLRILSGEYLYEAESFPRLFILCPWISDVDLQFSEFFLSEEEERLKEPGYSYAFVDYNIKSINLPYALLLLKLHTGVDVNIVTLPPKEPHYASDYLPRIVTLLDFLDEIGCNIFVNDKIHSKIIFADKIALLGSFNLTSSALYYRDEIGVSVNDEDNLLRLGRYCCDMIQESELYGYSSLLEWGITLGKTINHDQITRGFFLDYMIRNAFPIEQGSVKYREFFNVTGGYDAFIKSYIQDLENFYLNSLYKLILGNYDYPIDQSMVKRYSTDLGLKCIRRFFGFDNDYSPEELLISIDDKFARRKIPNIKLRIKSLLL
jgi:hypothetical protein